MKTIETDSVRPKDSRKRQREKVYYRADTPQYYRAETPQCYRAETPQYYRAETPQYYRAGTPQCYLPQIKSKCNHTSEPEEEKLRGSVLVTPSPLMEMIQNKENVTEELKEMMRKNAEPKPEPLVDSCDRLTDSNKRQKEIVHYRAETSQCYLPQINNHTPEPEKEKLRGSVLVTPPLLMEMIENKENVTEELKEMMRKIAEPKPEPLVLTPRLLKEMVRKVTSVEKDVDEPEEAVEVLLSPGMLKDLIQMNTQEKSECECEVEPTLLTVETIASMFKQPEEEFVLTGTMIMDLIQNACQQYENVSVKQHPKASNNRSAERASSVYSKKVDPLAQRSKQELLLTEDVLMRMIARVAGVKEDKEENCPMCRQTLLPLIQSPTVTEKKPAVDEDLQLMSNVLMKMMKKSAGVQEEIGDHRNSTSSMRRSTKLQKSKRRNKTWLLPDTCDDKEEDSIALTPKLIVEMMKNATKKTEPLVLPARKKRKKVKYSRDFEIETDPETKQKKTCRAPKKHKKAKLLCDPCSETERELPCSTPKYRKKIKRPCNPSNSALESDSESDQKQKNRKKVKPVRYPRNSEQESEPESPCQGQKNRKKVKPVRTPCNSEQESEPESPGQGQKNRKKVKPVRTPSTSELEPPCSPTKNHKKLKTRCSTEPEPPNTESPKQKSYARMTVNERRHMSKKSCYPETISPLELERGRKKSYPQTINRQSKLPELKRSRRKSNPQSSPSKCQEQE